MSVGLPADKYQIDQASGNLARTIEGWAAQSEQFKEYLDAAPDADLEQPPFNYTADEVALLKSAAADMALLANLYHGTATLDPARDLGVFTRRLAGLFLGS
jgi:hypothetical protein